MLTLRTAVPDGKATVNYRNPISSYFLFWFCSGLSVFHSELSTGSIMVIYSGKDSETLYELEMKRALKIKLA